MILTPCLQVVGIADNVGHPPKLVHALSKRASFLLVHVRFLNTHHINIWALRSHGPKVFPAVHIQLQRCRP